MDERKKERNKERKKEQKRKEKKQKGDESLAVWAMPMPEESKLQEKYSHI